MTFSAPGMVTQSIFLSGNTSFWSFRRVHADAVLQANMTILAPASKSFRTPWMVNSCISSGERSQNGQCS